MKNQEQYCNAVTSQQHSAFASLWWQYLDEHLPIYRFPEHTQPTRTHTLTHITAQVM